MKPQPQPQPQGLRLSGRLTSLAETLASSKIKEGAIDSVSNAPSFLWLVSIAKLSPFRQSRLLNIREATRVLDRLTAGRNLRHFQPKATIASRLNLGIQLRNIPNNLIQPSLVALPGTRSNRRSTLATNESGLIQPVVDFFHRDAGFGTPTLVLDLVAQLAKCVGVQLVCGCSSHDWLLRLGIYL
jgi:hypothetical protein